MPFLCHLCRGSMAPRPQILLENSTKQHCPAPQEHTRKSLLWGLASRAAPLLSLSLCIGREREGERRKYTALNYSWSDYWYQERTIWQSTYERWGISWKYSACLEISTTSTRVREFPQPSFPEFCTGNFLGKHNWGFLHHLWQQDFVLYQKYTGQKCAVFLVEFSAIEEELSAKKKIPLWMHSEYPLSVSRLWHQRPKLPQVLGCRY